MGKKKTKCIPDHQELLKLRTFTIAKKDPIWITLEKEMRENTHKPYNEKVGNWLSYMKDLIHHYYKTEKRNYQKLRKSVGPPWYVELSENQKLALNNLKGDLHRDHMMDNTQRTQKALQRIGMSLIIPSAMIMHAIVRSAEDPGIFFWYLYSSIYKVPPSKLLKRYDENAKLILSSMVFLDLDQCKKAIVGITGKSPPAPPKPPKKRSNFFQPDIKFGPYLQKQKIPMYSTHPSKISTGVKAPVLSRKVKLRSSESYLRLVEKKSFLQVRKEINMKENMKERVCTYKFWKPPNSLRTMNKELALFLEAQKMFSLKAQPKPLMNVSDNIKGLVKGVVYFNRKPIYQYESLSTLPTGYVPINGGYIMYGDGYILNILGYYRYPLEKDEKCSSTCNCLTDLYKPIFNHLKCTKCTCSHSYDYHDGKKTKEIFLHPPKDSVQHWVDYAKVYRFDPKADFATEHLEKAMGSSTTTVNASTETIQPSALKDKELLASYLAELSDTPLTIPHLPKAKLLKNLQALVRKRVKGKLETDAHKQNKLKSQRDWANLNRMDFRARAYIIPFTLKQLRKMDFSYRSQLEQLHTKLLQSFIRRTRNNVLENTQLFWNTMMYDSYPSQKFKDTFFAYLPGKLSDVHVFRPFDSQRNYNQKHYVCSLQR